MKRAIILASMSVLCLLQFGWGQIPRTFSYQGVLKDASGVLVDNTLTITFSLYDVETSETALWSEPQSVVVTQGVFSVILGKTSVLPDTFPAPAWLGITIGGSELTPRTELTSSPYSFHALRADTAQYALSAPTGVGAEWSLTGNSGTNPSANFLGTTDNVALEIRVDNARALRLEPHATSPNVIGGFFGNNVSSGVFGATIGGGGEATLDNRVTDNYGTVAGGQNNQAGDGAGTPDDQPYCTVGGGQSNTASGNNATIGGGGDNTASASYATVPGGAYNKATGQFSFAAGYGANADRHGSVVIAASQYGTPSYEIHSGGDYQMVLKAYGGLYITDKSDGTAETAPYNTSRLINTNSGAYLTTAGVWTDNSDRDKKENFTPVDGKEVLEKIAALPITRWNYKIDPDEIQHIGPVAQDFYALFGLGDSDKSLATLDEAGIAFAAI